MCRPWSSMPDASMRADRRKVVYLGISYKCIWSVWRDSLRYHLELHFSRWSPSMASSSSRLPRSMFLPNPTPMRMPGLGLMVSNARWVQCLWEIPTISLLFIMGIVCIPHPRTSARPGWHFSSFIVRRTCVPKVCPTPRASIISVCEAQLLKRQDEEILSGQNPSQAIVPCCVRIECGDSNEGKCVNTPASGVGDCKGELKVSVLPWKYRSTSWIQLMLWQGWRSMPRGEAQNHVLHALPRRTEHRVHKRIYDSGRSGDPWIPGGAPPW